MVQVNVKVEPFDEDDSEDVKMRPMNCELNALTRADGSALLAQGETVVLASTYGPIEVKMQNLQVERATVEVYYRSKIGVPTIQDRFKEAIIKGVCETALLTALHPRTAISIQIQEVENRCGLEACAVNAACLALLVSGIEMKFVVGALHCIIDKNNELVLDPDCRQAQDCLANFTFVFDSVNKNLVAVNTNGCFNTAQYNDAMTLCKAASEVIFKFYRKLIGKMHNK